MSTPSVETLLSEREQLLAQLHDVGRELIATRSERDAVREAYDALIAGHLATVQSERDALRCVYDRLSSDHRELSLSHGRIAADLQRSKYHATRFRWRAHALCTELFGPPTAEPLPPRTVPPELLDSFSMGNTVEISCGWSNRTVPRNWPLIYTDPEIDAYIGLIRLNLAQGSALDPAEWFIYGALDGWMCDAIAKYPISGKEVVNMGSMSPWYEAMFIHFGARPVTIDYNHIVVKTQRMKFMSVDEWERDRRRFDVGFSISSFEHDGLGAYGDPLDPDGDLKAMAKMKERISPGGLLLLSVPTGADKVVFNRARIYGRKRLPLLMQGWDWIDSFGFDEPLLESNGSVQPIFVLRNL
jgi:hypothetical protein